jgi:hypothetical protein
MVGVRVTVGVSVGVRVLEGVKVAVGVEVVGGVMVGVLEAVGVGDGLPAQSALPTTGWPSLRVPVMLIEAKGGPWKGPCIAEAKPPAANGWLIGMLVSVTDGCPSMVYCPLKVRSFVGPRNWKAKVGTLVVSSNEQARERRACAETGRTRVSL